MAEITPAGLDQLIAEEGEVLRAYRDVAGVWTIGVGLTAASGVIAPRAGMTITRAESRRLLAQALTARYEPAVAKRMPNATAHAFDGAVSFHFNTGAISRASWVADWQAGRKAAARAGILAWNKAGGRMVEGLRLRRMREADLILEGRRTVPPRAQTALGAGDSGEDVRALQQDLVTLGVWAGPADGVFGPATEKAVHAFQASHPNLTADGIAGPATRAQIDRALDARRKLAVTVASGTLVGGGVVATGKVEPASIDPSLPFGAIAVGVALVTLLALCVTGWRYRDEIRSFIRLKRSP